MPVADGSGRVGRKSRGLVRNPGFHLCREVLDRRGRGRVRCPHRKQRAAKLHRVPQQSNHMVRLELNVVDRRIRQTGSKQQASKPQPPHRGHPTSSPRCGRFSLPPERFSLRSASTSHTHGATALAGSGSRAHRPCLHGVSSLRRKWCSSSWRFDASPSSSLDT